MIHETVHEGNLSTVVKIFDDVYYREGSLEIRDQCNCGFVELDHSVALIDYPEQDPEEELIDEAERLIRKPVKYIFLTHAHVDHVTGFKTLNRKDISLVATKACIDQLLLEGYPLPPIHLAVTCDRTLLLDGFEFKLELPGQTAHSPWDMLIGIPKYQLLFTGDLIVKQKYLYFHSSLIDGWLETIDLLKTRDWQHLAMGHGPIQDKHYLDEIGHYLTLLAEAKAMIADCPDELARLNSRENRRNLQPHLAKVVRELFQISDDKNVIRQISQLMVRSELGY